MAVAIGRSGERAPRVFSGRWMLAQLFSFEASFVLFLYSNEIKVLLPTLPIDETLLFGALSMAIGAWLIWRDGIYLPGLVIVTAAFAFVAFALISYGWTPSKILFKQRIAYMLVFNMWCVIGGGLIIASSRARTLRFLCLVLALSMLIAAAGMRIYLVYGNFRTLDMWDELGFSRTYLNWGYTVADGAAVAVVIGLFSRFLSIKQLALFACFVLCAAFLLVGGARGPLLGVALAGLVVICVRLPVVGPGRLEVSVGQLAGVTVAFLAVALIVTMIATGRATTTLSRFMALAEQAEGERGVEGASRWAYWPAAVRFFLDAPIVGHGFASFSILFHKGAEKPGAHPHNVVLETAAELGTVGLLLFFAFIWSGLRLASLRRLRTDPLMVCVLAYFIAAIQNSMFAKELTGGRKLFFAVALFAVPAATRAIRAVRPASRADRTVVPARPTTTPTEP
ncbi:MAG: O-antigen ligase family protein [Geminicoccaceae bacterium]